MNGESVFGWIKVVVTLILFALVGFLLWKLYKCVSTPLDCLKAALDTLKKFFQGTGSLNVFKMGTAFAGNSKPGQVKTVSPDVTSDKGDGGAFSGCEWSRDPNVTCGTTPLRIDICATPDGTCN